MGLTKAQIEEWRARADEGLGFVEGTAGWLRTSPEESEDLAADLDALVEAAQAARDALP